MVPLERELEDYFKNSLSFATESYAIDSGQPSANFTKKLMEFRNQHEHEKSLLIYVYSCHSDAGRSGV